MNCSCEFLYNILPTDASKIQAWAAIITSGIALIALYSWKLQKRYEVITEGRVNIFRCLETYKTLCNYKEILHSNLDGTSEGYSPSRFFDQTIIPYLGYSLLLKITEALKANNEKLKGDILTLNYEAFKIISFNELVIFSWFSKDDELLDLKNYYKLLLKKLIMIDSDIASIDEIILNIEKDFDNEDKYIIQAKELLKKITTSHEKDLLEVQVLANSLLSS